MGLQLDGTTGITYTNLNQDIKSLLLPKNWIINGMFDVWQRGDSVVKDHGYTSDMWFVSYATGGTNATVTRQEFTIGQTLVPNNPKNYMRLSGTSSVNEGKLFGTRIEHPQKFSNKKYQLSFWIKSSTSLTLTLDSGITTIGATQTVKSAISVATTTSWEKKNIELTVPNLTGVVFDETDYWRIQFNIPNGVTFQIDIANVSLVEVSVAVECQNQPYADVLRECQWYYRRITSGSATVIAIGYAYATTHMVVTLPMPTKMRVVPTELDYSNIRVSNGNIPYTISNLIIWGTNEYIIGFDATTTGLTQYAPYYLEFISGGWVGFSAEL